MGTWPRPRASPVELRRVPSLGCREDGAVISPVRPRPVRRVVVGAPCLEATYRPTPRGSAAGTLPFAGEHLRDSRDLRRDPVADLRTDRTPDGGADPGQGSTALSPGPALGLPAGIVGRQRAGR